MDTSEYLNTIEYLDTIEFLDTIKYLDTIEGLVVNVLHLGFLHHRCQYGLDGFHVLWKCKTP